MNKPFFVFVCHWVYLRAFHKTGYVHKGCPSSLCEPREPERARKVMGQYHLQKGTRMMFDSWSMISIELDRYRSELYFLLRCNWLLHLLVITCMCVCLAASAIWKRRRVCSNMFTYMVTTYLSILVAANCEKPTTIAISGQSPLRTNILWGGWWGLKADYLLGG